MHFQVKGSAQNFEHLLLRAWLTDPSNWFSSPCSLKSPWPSILHWPFNLHPYRRDSCFKISFEYLLAVHAWSLPQPWAAHQGLRDTGSLYSPSFLFLKQRCKNGWALKNGHTTALGMSCPPFASYAFLCRFFALLDACFVQWEQQGNPYLIKCSNVTHPLCPLSILSLLYGVQLLLSLQPRIKLSTLGC